MWNAFHDALPNNNSNKFPSFLRATCLHSQLSARAKDMWSALTQVELTGENGMDLFLDCIYKRHALSIVIVAFRSFITPLNTKRSLSETMKKF